MKLFPFYYKKQLYYTSYLDEGDSKMSNFDEMYHKCFQNYTSIDDLIYFSQDKGINLIIFNTQDNIVFLTTFIYNSMSDYIEMYNVCKYQGESKISATYLIRHFIQDLISGFTLFNKSTKLLLSLDLRNPYFVRALICYLNIGFRYVKEQLPQLITIDSNFIQMTYDTMHSPNNTPYQDFIIIINNHLFDKDKLIQLYQQLDIKGSSLNTENSNQEIYQTIINYLGDKL